MLTEQDEVGARAANFGQAIELVENRRRRIVGLDINSSGLPSVAYFWAANSMLR